MSSQRGQDSLVDTRGRERCGQACHQAGGVLQALEFLRAVFTCFKMPGNCLDLLWRQIVEEGEVELYDRAHLWARVASRRQRRQISVFVHRDSLCLPVPSASRRWYWSANRRFAREIRVAAEPGEIPRIAATS